MCEEINENFPRFGVSVCYAISNDASSFWLCVPFISFVYQFEIWFVFESEVFKERSG